MTVALRRLRAQGLTGRRFGSAIGVVGHLGAVQAQDDAGARWALGLRARGVTDREVQRLFDRGAILRTHVLRPTWHFVLPDDVRWLLELTAPRVEARLAYHDPRLEIDPALLRRSYAVVEVALRDERYLTRAELAAALGRAGIRASGQRLAHLLMHAEVQGIVVSGPRRGRQFTYALLEERAPGGRRLERDEALAELTRRYFTSGGPARARDFAWWSGLTMADVERGLTLAAPNLVREEIEGSTHWSAPGSRAAANAPRVHLLPSYDEFLVAYRDRTAALARDRLDTALPANEGVLGQVVVVDGQVRGRWRRRAQAGTVVVELDPIDDLDPGVDLGRAADDLADFLGLPVTVAGGRRPGTGNAGRPFPPG